jgi:hypothetical protein
VALGFGGQLSGSPALCFSLHPRCKIEFNKRKGKEDEKEDNAGKKNQDGKGSPGVSLERDVAKAEGSHHHKGPVKAGEPRVLLPFRFHEKVKRDAVKGDHNHQNEQELQKQTNIALGAFLLYEITEEGGVKLHSVESPLRMLLGRESSRKE